MNRLLLALLLPWLLAPARLLSAEEPVTDLRQREEQAMKAAVQRVGPSVVSIDTVGGLERVGELLIGTGPTTGLIVSQDGYIVSSAFNFVQKPSSILVGLADGTRLPAQLVATDHSRMLVLLKITPPQSLTVPEAVPHDEMQVGQWSIAVGRAFEPSVPNISVGIISALARVWGKAIQTDAKVSPNNYGGPLVDIRGRVLGVLVPLSPTEGGEMAGVEWYDSGIGFAIPLAHIQQMLDRFKQGDLQPGLMGISLEGKDLYSAPARIVACRPNSPAYKGGLKAGDTIVEIEGRPIERPAHVLEEVNRRYAGDTIKLTVARGDERLERQLELVAELEPYQRPFLGLLPSRALRDQVSGVEVRYVYPQSGAARAGLQIGDRIVSAAGAPVANSEELAAAVTAIEPGQTLSIELLRGTEKLLLEPELSTEPASVPAELPPVAEVQPEQPAAAEQPATGAFALKVPEFPNECLAYVPSGYDPRRSYGLLIWLHGAVRFADDEVLAPWRDVCEQQQLILLAPKSADQRGWQPADLDFVRKAADQLRAAYQVNPMRVLAYGRDTGGTIAYALAFKHRDLVRGVVAVDSPLPGQPPDHDPAYRLAFYLATASKSAHVPAPSAAIEPLTEQKYPLFIRDLGEQARDLNDSEQAELLRWIDSLDRI